MENNSKLRIFITILLVCDFTFPLNRFYGVCTNHGYYHCSGYRWCCPDGYKCSSYSDCYKRIYYSLGSSNVGAIVGGVIGGLVGLVFFCACMCACCSKLSDACCTGKVESTKTQSDGQNITRAIENRQETGRSLETSHPIQEGPSIPSISEPAYPPPSYHV